VRSVAPLSPLAKAGVKKKDILLTMDKNRINGDGTLMWNVGRHTVTLPLATLITMKPAGTETKLEFLRITDDNKRENYNVNVVFEPLAPLVARFDDAPMSLKGRERFSAEPSYFLFWGLVWGVFSNPVFEQAKGNVPWSVQKFARHQWLKDANEEVIVLLHGLSSPCIEDYDVKTMRILWKFNGVEVKNMADFIKAAGAAEQSKQEFMRFTYRPLAAEDIGGTALDPDVVLTRSTCQGIDSMLMPMNGIMAPVSAGYKEAHTQAFKGVEAASEDGSQDVQGAARLADPKKKTQASAETSQTGESAKSSSGEASQKPAGEVDSSGSLMQKGRPRLRYHGHSIAPRHRK